MSGRGKQLLRSNPPVQVNAGWVKVSGTQARAAAWGTVAVKPDIKSNPKGEMPWSERPPDGTGGNLAVAFGRAV